MSFTAMVSVCQTHSVLQSVSANIVTVLIARCMAIGHARDVTALQTEFKKSKHKLSEILHPASTKETKAPRT